MRVPRRLQELSAKVNQATDKLTNELQRSPKVEEIAEYLDVTVDEVLEAMESSSAYTSVPIEAPGASDSDDAPSILDRYADDDNELDFTDDRLVIEEAIRDFSPRERGDRAALCEGHDPDRDRQEAGYFSGAGFASAAPHA